MKEIRGGSLLGKPSRNGKFLGGPGGVVMKWGEWKAGWDCETGGGSGTGGVAQASYEGFSASAEAVATVCGGDFARAADFPLPVREEPGREIQPDAFFQ